jgi:hypothetical protein
MGEVMSLALGKRWRIQEQRWRREAGIRGQRLQTSFIYECYINPKFCKRFWSLSTPFAFQNIIFSGL